MIHDVIKFLALQNLQVFTRAKDYMNLWHFYASKY